MAEYKPDYPERDHGYGKPPEVIGVPKVIETTEQAQATGNGCPNCGCITLYMIEVEVVAPKILKGDRAKGVYAGCPACPWASSMMIRGW